MKKIYVHLKFTVLNGEICIFNFTRMNNFNWMREKIFFSLALYTLGNIILLLIRL